MPGATFDTTDRVKAVEYIERMARELRSIASQQKLDFLAYLIEMAREEAARESAAIRVKEKA